MTWYLGLVSPANAVIVYTYDFPGSPGSGLAANQTGPQPANGSFSDFVRVNLNSSAGAGVFTSSNWNQTGIIDTTQYVGFSIAADASYHLELTDLVFDARISATGPADTRVALFVNGSSTAYATLDIAPTSTVTTYAFDFTDLTAADNATTVDVRFYGYNAGGAGGTLLLDNVVTSGVITNVPEFEPAWLAFFVIAVSLLAEHRRARRVRTPRN